jgi:hypothetical protein
MYRYVTQPDTSCINLWLTKKFQEHLASLGCNFTISFGGFSKQAHLDNNAFRYVFRIYIFVDLDGNLVTGKALIEECMEAGQFIWPDLHLGLDPPKCNGIALFLGHGSHERHYTIECKIMNDQKVIQYRNSIQVNQGLLSQTVKYHQEMAAYQVQQEFEKHGRAGAEPVIPVQPTVPEKWVM